MTKPKVSIIVTVYKAENYLQKCLNSIKNQTFQDWECILVDDGSPDKSGAICDEYVAKDSRFRVIHKQNGGVSMARQSGIEAALGEYSIHCDPDDWVESEMLKDMYKVAITEGADMVISDFYWDDMRKSRTMLQNPTSLNCEDIIKDIIRNKLHGNCWNKLVRHSLYRDLSLSFPQGFVLYEDMYVVISLLLNNIKVSYLNKAYYHYVIGVNANSLSQGVGQSYEYDVMMYDKFVELLKSTNASSDAKVRFGTNIIRRSFYREEFNNKQFSEYCSKYADSYSGIPGIMPFCYRISCKGFYLPSRILIKNLKNLRKLKRRLYENCTDKLHMWFR